MTRLAWRLQRPTALAAIGLLSALAVVLFWHRGTITDFIASYDPATACGSGVPADECRLDPWQLPRLDGVEMLWFIVPILVGVFWGAPLFARELERRTHLLVLTQSVGRARWFSRTLGLAATGALLMGAASTLLYAWYVEPVRSHMGLYLFDAKVFASRGLVPVAYVVFALVLGAVVGLVLRRTVPAMLITGMVFIAVVMGAIYLRPMYLEPTVQTTPIGQEAVRLGTPAEPVWHVRSGYIDKQGVRHEDGSTYSVCPYSSSPTGQQDWEGCLARTYDVQFTEYHPADRWWTFQLLETGLLLVFTMGLAGFGLWRIRSLST